MRIIVDDEQLFGGSAEWWKSLDPATRGVFMQACWEIEGCPEPRERGPASPEAAMAAPTTENGDAGRHHQERRGDE